MSEKLLSQALTQVVYQRTASMDCRLSFLYAQIFRSLFHVRVDCVKNNDLQCSFVFLSFLALVVAVFFTGFLERTFAFKHVLRNSQGIDEVLNVIRHNLVVLHISSV